ncbi:ABC transporter ATP-binding protein [Hirschia baltica]|uniref:ABC transporter related n=1 Tax=Hirschia baltica (strain ATCC 49814 / DSM 5838 / IFAM 1418) TaxID=582402 RepID=C6XRL1_HIRBI|nr:ATP-binding cassette domain-containing protein [Hirschia baltica]ACT60621.1 ABC transporter related [Hirschia baltica ATCC 49814]
MNAPNINAQSPLELRATSKFFKGKAAVKDMSFSAPKGQILGFLGPNGAGKSTSLRIALGVLSPDSGEALLFGEKPNLKNLRRVGFLPEERGLYRKMTTRAIISYYGRLKGLDRKTSLSRADEMLQRFGLGDHLKTKISDLSKGMAQKVQILSTLVHKPDLIILDEPFSGLDPVNQQDLELLIREEHARGATIIFSTHVMEHAERLCDRLVIIGKGQKRFDGTIDEAMSLIPETADISTEGNFDLHAALEKSGFTSSYDKEDETGKHWRIDLSHGERAQDVLRAAINAGAPITSFTPHRAKLRDVFVSLVGEDESPAETEENH